jgi:hypothetical protein
MARSRSGRRLERLCHPHELVAAQRARNDEQQASVPVSCPTAGFVVGDRPTPRRAQTGGMLVTA